MTQRLITRYWWVASLVLLCLLPLLWFRQDYLLYSEESTYINYGFIWDKYQALWSEHLNNGYTHYFFPFFFPHAPYWKLLSSLGFSLVFIQRSFSVLIWSLIVLTSYKFFSLFTPNRLLALIGVCVYLLNPYTGSTIFYTAKIFQLLLMPAVFFLTYRFLKDRKIDYLLLNFLLIYLFQGIFCNPPQAISTFASLPLAWLYRLSEKGSQKLKSTLYFVALCLVISPIFITNAWIYLQNLTPEELNTALAQNTFEALKTDPVKIAQFRGAWWEGLLGPEGIPYDPNSSFYQNPVIEKIALAIFGFIFLPLVFRKINRTYLFWLATLAFFFFLTKGTAGFGSTLFSILYNKIVLLRIFREPWAKFIPSVIFSTSALLVTSLELLKNVNPKVSPIFPSLLFTLVIIRGYPTYTTKVVDHTNKNWKRMDVKIPDYWLEAKKWSEKYPEENVFVLPQPLVSTKDYYFHWYYLNPGNFKGPLPFLLLNSNLQWNNYIDGFWSRTANFSTFINYFHPQAFALLNTKYILVMNDVRPTTLGDLSFPQIKFALKETPIQSFGEGKLEILEPKKPSPGIIYLPLSTVNYFGAVDDTTASLSLVNSQDYPLIKNNPRPEEVGSNPIIVAVDLNEKNYQESPFQPESFVELIPQARLNPKHFLYRLALLREHWREATAASDQDKIDLLLWHSAKRLNELETFSDLKSEEREKIKEDFCQKIAQVESILHQFPVPEEKQLPLFRKTTSYLPLLIGLAKPLKAKQEKVECLGRLLTYLDKSRIDLKQKTCSYCAKVDIPAGGTWEVLQESRNPPPIRITVGEHNLSSKDSKTTINQWRSLGKIELTPETYSLRVNFPEGGNLIQTPLKNLPPNLLAISSSATNSQERKPLLFQQDVSGWKANTRYNFTFSYKGEPELYVVEKIVNWDEVTQPNLPLDLTRLPTQNIVTSYLRLNKSNVEKEITLVVASHPFALGATFFVSEPTGKNSASISNMQVREVPIKQKLFFRQIPQEASLKESKLPKVEFVKISPTQYRVTIEGAKETFPLVFSQSYHPRWKISWPQAEHFLANGYANGWTINPGKLNFPEKLELTIEFSPQQPYLVLTTICLFLAGGCITHLLVWKIIRRKI